MFESARKKLQIKKYPDTCEQGLKKAPLSLQGAGTIEALGKMLIYYRYVIIGW